MSQDATYPSLLMSEGDTLINENITDSFCYNYKSICYRLSKSQLQYNNTH